MSYDNATLRTLASKLGLDPSETTFDQASNGAVRLRCGSATHHLTADAVRATLDDAPRISIGPAAFAAKSHQASPRAMRKLH